MVAVAQPVDRDTWSTPRALVQELARRYAGGAFDLDPCCSPLTAKAPRFYTKDDDGLAQPWFGRVWINPPYSNITPWVDKAIAEANAGRIDVAVMLLINSTDTAWFARLKAHVAMTGAGELVFPQGRVSFVPPEGLVPLHGNNRGSLIAVVRPMLPALRDLCQG